MIAGRRFELSKISKDRGEKRKGEKITSKFRLIEKGEGDDHEKEDDHREDKSQEAEAQQGDRQGPGREKQGRARQRRSSQPLNERHGYANLPLLSGFSRVPKLSETAGSHALDNLRG